MIRCLIATAAVVLALAGAGGAAAATLDDIRALGYQVYIQFESSTCRAWSVSGFGISTSLGCEGTADFQAAVDSIANPPVHYERKWQFEHPEQLSAANELVGKGYAVNRTAPATDSWSIAGGLTNVVVAGAELPGLAATLPKLEASAGPSQTVPSVDGTGTVTVPGSAIASESESASTDSTASETGSEAGPLASTSFRTTSSGLLWTDAATASRVIVPRGKFVVY